MTPVLLINVKNYICSTNNSEGGKRQKKKVHWTNIKFSKGNL